MGLGARFGFAAAIAAFSAAPAEADTSSGYGAIEFDGIRIETPLGWRYDDEVLRQQLEQKTRESLQLNKSAVPAVPNNIVLAAALPDTAGRNTATLRLSVRKGPAPTQADMHNELANVSQDDVAAVIAPAMAESIRLARSMPGVTTARAIGGMIARNSTLTCLFTEMEYTQDAATWRTQTWVCPAGRRTVKLSTSYRMAEAAVARPVIAHMWQTLAIGP